MGLTAGNAGLESDGPVAGTRRRGPRLRPHTAALWSLGPDLDRYRQHLCRRVVHDYMSGMLSVRYKRGANAHHCRLANLGNTFKQTARCLRGCPAHPGRRGALWSRACGFVLCKTHASLI